MGLSSPLVRNSLVRQYQSDAPGPISRFGLEFPNPIGLAAGFDKNGNYLEELSALGFGFIEVGTVTNQPQPGNPKPRLFRLPKDRALINRLGFNNLGAIQVAANLAGRRPKCVVGVNIGKSRAVDIEAAIPDYLASFNAIYSAADYIVVNVSSPNTPHLRELQRAQPLEELLTALQQRNRELSGDRARKPLLLKIAPDVSETEIEQIVDVATRTQIAGMVATNTTIQREGLQTQTDQLRSYGDGGLSGAPLRARSNQIISFIYKLTGGRLPIIGVGGVFTADDAWEKISAGASLIQLYTGFIYEGPGIVARINEGLNGILRKEGFSSLDDAVGCGGK